MLNPRGMNFDPDILEAYVDLCNQALQQQSKSAKGWPNPLILPEPENRHERKALDLFMDELSHATGAKVYVRFQPRR